MQLRADQLDAHLARGKLAPLYVVSGDEALLSIEAQDAIRAAARKQGFSEREVAHADGRSDWSVILGAAQGLSLFAERRILEIRLPGGKPGKDGGEALKTHAQASSDELLTIVSLPALDKTGRNSAWAAALAGAGVWVDVPTIERAALPAWIGQRLARQQQKAPKEALEFIADRVEGNLLAAHQEISKLALLHPAGELTLAQVQEAVLDVSRYEVFGLPGAMLAGDRPRLLKMIAGLRAENEPLPLILWAVSEEIRTLLRLRAALDRGLGWGQATREVWVRREKEQATQAALKRLDVERLGALLARCADLDRLFKGLRVKGRDSDPWLELAEICLGVC
ncbi:MAG: DNA polymerase III subunit delta [Burkholderiaceae bacterium]|nr:DNA polymerase III subunit delta [Burkholderiaceae bacterium]